MPISRGKLREMAASLGISEIGVTTAEPLIYMQNRLQRRIEENRLTPFEEENPQMRISVKKILTGCKSVITLAVPYAALDENQPAPAAGPRGMVARCARGLDYHHIALKKAELVAELIAKEAEPGHKWRILADRSPLIERELARNSAVGLIGENCTLINLRFGSYVSLATILTTLKLEPDEKNKANCSSCSQCQKECPTGALIEPYIIDPFRCLSYLTQASGIFPRNMRRLLDNRIYGCDRCQEVCPENREVEYSNLPEGAFSFFPAEPMLIPLLEMTQKEFDLTIGLTSAGWRGKTTLQRNAVIALGNRASKSEISTLARLLENDPRPVIRLHSAWAIGAIGGSKAKYYLEKSFLNDPEPPVRAEAEQSRAEL